MSRLTSWREAELADRQDIRCFECAEAPPRRGPSNLYGKVKPPYWWEYDVQSALRRYRPPLPERHHLLVGHDPIGLAWVTKYTEVDGAGLVALDYMALAMRLRLRPRGAPDLAGAYAIEMASATLDTIAGRALETGVTLVEVSGNVYHKNRASQRLCRQLGFVLDSQDEGVQTWRLNLQPLPSTST